IRNMVAVLEVISSLERYPITKEALEETRLGKLVNDVRKKTKNEELAKRAKKLLRSWQKLIEPVQQNEVALRGANGGAHNCRPEAGASVSKGVPDLKHRNDLQRLPGPRLDRLGSRKRRGDQRDLGHPGPPPKVSKACHDLLGPNSSPLPTNGISGSPESFSSPLDGSGLMGSEGSRLEAVENDQLSGKVPVNAVRPHPSSPGLGQPPGPCLQAKVEETSGPPHPRAPSRCSFSPRNSRHEGSFARQRSPYTPKGSVPSPSPRPLVLEATQVPSPPPLDQPPRAGFSPDSSKADSDAASSGGSDSRKKKRYRPRDYTVNLDGQVAEAGVKPVRLKERKLTFDPMTRQIKPLTQKEPMRADSPVHTEQPPRTELDKQEAKASLQSPFEQTNWKELSRNEIIQSYLSRQSSLLSSSGAQTPGAHPFMAEYLRQEESTRRGARQPHVLVPHAPPADLPGLSREVTQGDLDRLQADQWPGVNGCQDTQGNWYDWTQCISLDPHGDDGRLNVLPYVCLD
ncbi:Mediator of RNA polymerase II transcription subunit 26, partial [Heterocephalus glaber]